MMPSDVALPAAVVLYRGARICDAECTGARRERRNPQTTAKDATVPDGDRWYIQLLERLGVNTTKLRWRIYQKEQQAKRLIETGGRPAALSWWSYPNKVCPHCRAINNADLKVCTSCGKRLPTMAGYRVRRLVATVVPAEGPVVSMAFLTMMIVFWAAQIFIDGIGVSSVMGPSGGALHVLGAFTAAYAVDGGEYWRILAFGLVHGGLFHIGMNSYFLVQIGPALESQLTRARMLSLITLSQVAAAVTCYLWYGQVQNMWYVPIVGASGWLFGLLGFGVVFAHRAGILSMRDSLLRSALFMFILGFVINSYSNGGGISNAAHFGGMMGGVLFGVLPESSRMHPRSAARAWNAIGWICFVLWLAAIVFAALCVIRFWPELRERA